MEKMCSTCGALKPAGAFWRDARRKDGLFGECKACAGERNLRWHRDNREASTARNAAAVRRYRNLRPMEQVLRSIQSRSRKLGIPCTITIADLAVPNTCPVLGIPLRSSMGHPDGTAKPKGWRDFSPSVDRIDPRGGYTPDNIIVVSLRANRIKSDASVAEIAAVADFYRRLEDDRRRKGPPGRPKPEVAGLSTAVSAVFAAEAEEERPLSSCDGEAGADTGALPPLFLGSNFR